MRTISRGNHVRVSRFLSALLFLVCSLAASAAEVVLNSDRPTYHRVVKGDTLWAIAGLFLQEPWRWPEVWQQNPLIKNPHLIYPGDVLGMDDVNGKPRIYIKTASDLRLSPQIRSSPIAQAIPAIPSDAIKQFLTSSRVVSRQQLQQAPYVIDFAGEHVIGGAGDRTYVRAIASTTHRSFTVYRPGIAYKDGETGEILGYQALYVADSQLERPGDPAILQLTRAVRETLIGDRLLTAEADSSQLYYLPRAPAKLIKGHIISLIDGVSQIGQYQVVVIDRGSYDGLATGHVLAIYQSGRITRDIISGTTGQTIKLPNEKAGVLLVFRPFERVSYGLVMEASRALHALDIVQTP